MGMVCGGGGGWELKVEANITGCDVCFNVVEITCMTITPNTFSIENL